MRNSAWYHKLWSKKFDSLPIKDAADASWAGMHKLLNEQLPAGTVGGNPPGISAGAKLFKILGYAFSAAVTVSTVVYVTVPHSKSTRKEIVKENKGLLTDSILTDSNKIESYSKLVDSNLINNRDTSNNLTAQHVNTDSSIAVGDENKTVAGGTKKEGNSTVAGLHAVSTSGYQNSIMQKTDRSGVFVNSASQSSNDQSAAAVTVNSLFKSAKLQLMAPGKFGQENVFQNDSTNHAKNLTTLQPVMQIYANDNGLRTAGSTAKNRDKNKPAGNNTGKVKKTKPAKIKVPKTPKASNEDDEPKYGYGITGGMNVQKSGSSFYAGLFGSYALNKKWQLIVGVNINSAQKLAREFTHPSYYRPDSLPPFTIADERKVIAVDIPLAAAYRLSKKISIKAGPIIAFSIKQSDVFTKLKPIADPRDTLYHGKAVDSALVNTVANKVSIGFMGGISVHLKRFDINGSYQWLKPNKISNSLGTSNQANQFFKIGVGYRFK
jgi:hypothetical protein